MVERAHVWFIVAALGFALLGGLILAVSLPLEITFGGRIDAQWISHAQLHGHLQTVGFVGLFIVGVAYRLLPGFSGAQGLPLPRLVPVSFWLLAGGVLARAAGQPIAHTGAGAGVLSIAGFAELAGALCFAANVLPLTWRAVRAGQPFAPFFAAGATWFLAQAALGAAWLTELGLDQGTVVPQSRNDILVFLQFFGFHLMFILGVAVRSFPIFFAAKRPTLRGVAVAWGAVQAGTALVVLGALLGVIEAGRGWVVGDVGMALVGAGLVWCTFFTGWWRSPTRLRPASRPFAYTLQPAMAWLTLAGLLLVVFGLRAAVRGLPAPFPELDAVRHIVAIGVVLMTIVGMAQLLLPEFAGERLAGKQGAWRGAAVGIVLSLTTLARSGSRLLSGQLPGETMYWLMAVAGMTALVVILLLGFYFIRGARGLKDAVAAAGARAVRQPPVNRDW